MFFSRIWWYSARYYRRKSIHFGLCNSWHSCVYVVHSETWRIVQTVDNVHFQQYDILLLVYNPYLQKNLYILIFFSYNTLVQDKKYTMRVKKWTALIITGAEVLSKLSCLKQTQGKLCAKLWNQAPSLDHFVVQNSGDFLCWKYKEDVCFYVSNLRQ